MLLGALDQRGEDPVDALGGALGRGPTGGDRVLVARGVDAREEQQSLDRARRARGRPVGLVDEAAAGACRRLEGGVEVAGQRRELGEPLGLLYLEVLQLLDRKSVV